ncbi:hypothetical protein Dvar_67960 [Desulfosarcina variabilis str. Montpellier]
MGCKDEDYDLDFDEDGVVDCIDACPTEYGKGTDGCPDHGLDPTDPKICKNGKLVAVSEQGNPISIYTGNKVESEKDLNFTSPFAEGLTFRRFYNSQSEIHGPMGYGWTHNYNVTLTEVTNSNGEYLRIMDETGFSRYFNRKPDPETGAFLPRGGERTSLTARDNTYIWQRHDGTTYTFHMVSKQLLHIEDPLGNRLNVFYSSTNNQLIETVTDEAGDRALEFSYTSGLLSTIRLVSGGIDAGVQVTYGHDENRNLTTVTFADGSGFVYTYDDTNNGTSAKPFINNLTRKVDAAGHFLAGWAYNSADRCYFNETPDGRGVTIDYDSTADGVIVTDAYGVSRTYGFATISARKRIATVSGGAGCSSCSDEPIRWEYDLQLNVTEIEYANGRIDRFADFDARGNAGTAIRAVGTADEQTMTSTWHPLLNKPLTRAQESVMGGGTKVTTWDYDDDGNEIANENPTPLLHRIVVSGYTRNASGALTAVESVTLFSYDSRGLLLGVDGPLEGAGDTTTFAYDSATGDLLSVTRPVSGSTTFSEYDAAGRPGRITDPNLNSIDYAYDGRGRVSSMTRMWDSAVTNFTYTPAGKPDTVSLPNGIILNYEYDSTTGRLVSITDVLGNRVAHGYDDQGNIIETGYLLASGTRTFLERFDYQHPNRPGKLWKQINPDDSFFEYAYDSVGNLYQVTDPEGRTTTYGHDLLGRQASVVQPGTVATDLNYDVQGNLVLVTDPESRTTEYVVDDLGRTVTVNSPDTGTTRYAYDAAGNLTSKTDANGITSTYTYDDEYRLTGIHYPDAGQDVTYTYDQGADGVGRLTGMSDASGSYVYGWDEAGNIVSEEKTIDGIVYTTEYAYDAAGLLTAMTYPDGTVVSYQRDAAGNVSQVSAVHNGTTTVLASGIDYLPFGPMQTMTLGNGIGVNRSFDLLYRMTGNISTGVQNSDYGHDRLGNVTAVTDNLNSTRDLSFDYDDLYRLTGAGGIYGTLSFSMDDTGNRLSRTADGVTETYAYTTGTSLLDQIVGSGTVDITTDAAGNTTVYGNRTLDYDQDNRLVRVQEDGITLATYVTSADGRRMMKTVDGSVTVYHYDLEGHLIAESDGQGNLTRLYIYLNGAPLSMVVADGETDGVYYYHNDHLGTPQRLTDVTGTVAWAADYLPFGGVDITVETVENNLRFAGQYYDAETGLHYNYHRYYDPDTGRYLTADPIGLAGGINLFAYVSNDPVNYIDPTGELGFSLARRVWKKIVAKHILGTKPAGTLFNQEASTVKKLIRKTIKDGEMTELGGKHGTHFTYNFKRPIGTEGETTVLVTVKKGSIRSAYPVAGTILGIIGVLVDPFDAISGELSNSETGAITWDWRQNRTSQCP